MIACELRIPANVHRALLKGLEGYRDGTDGYRRLSYEETLCGGRYTSAYYRHVRVSMHGMNAISLPDIDNTINNLHAAKRRGKFYFLKIYKRSVDRLYRTLIFASGTHGVCKGNGGKKRQVQVRGLAIQLSRSQRLGPLEQLALQAV